MKIVITQGDHAADYIVKNFKDKGHKLIVINSSKENSEYIMRSNKVPVVNADPTKKEALDIAHIDDADIFIALGYKDCDNYVSCVMAKKLYNVKKCICIVSNPKNVENFRRLGLDAVISSTQELASSIVAESSLEDLIKTLPLEEDKIVLTEVVIRPNYAISGKKIMDIHFPKTGNISCIYRTPIVIIPNGSTVILPKDKLLILSTPNHQKELLNFIRQENPEGK